MERKLRHASWVALGVLGLAWDVAAARVVGLRGSYEDVFVAVRGVVPAGTVVRGIRFYSNDATVFPAVLLAADGGEARLPRVGAVVRSVARVVGQPGYLDVEFPPYEVTQAERLWAIVRFPDRSPMLGAGLGGGPAIGWREARELAGERSLFWVMGAVNEFSPAFDISLMTTASSLKPVGGAASPSQPTAASAALDVRPWMEVHWDGRDSSGRAVANGIYLYRVQLDGERRTGKVVLWR